MFRKESDTYRARVDLRMRVTFSAYLGKWVWFELRPPPFTLYACVEKFRARVSDGIKETTLERFCSYSCHLSRRIIMIIIIILAQVWEFSTYPYYLWPLLFASTSWRPHTSGVAQFNGGLMILEISVEWYVCIRRNIIMPCKLKSSY